MHSEAHADDAEVDKLTPEGWCHDDMKQFLEGVKEGKVKREVIRDFKD